ncbi:MAG: TonB-dependent receptor plug domain-containing protein, partial [Gemmatimonadetes bacterium]|nr:TonB-dependent receptor plug domain-containing protein [Gemmatimonadota bacterium]NIR77494.1 TonB-dependent receptor plug domain-containing protein [Gemmatimonadota bacterium]NIT86025.1 TonB-dependent receptor plug domain-containing protein [Gemmatimonadota bacterium]NIU29845.1 TonB-dependent receptor plug domain-containing protein [Gemmatimonadota bacterium]NIU34855.1 TonB-dependent receptor plug domain-containing protein [Gemmatimonadota bacterium]
MDTLPALPDGIPPGPGAGVWEWSREEIMAARAHTLAQLLAEVPGLVPLRGGDYGMPRTVAFPGAAGGGMRIFRDGVEHLPLSGSVPDLARIGLGGIDRVRVERSGGGLRVELRSHRPADPRPFSVVEAGTGDLDTNLLRGAFLHPSALGGNAGVALDRVDSQGRDFQQPGSSSSIWLRYTFVGGARFGVAAELSRATQDRDTLFLPSRVTRTDWSVRVRARLAEGVVADAFWARADLEADTSDVTDPAEAVFPFRSEARAQLGARLAAGRGPLFGRFAVRSFDGEGLPSSSIEVEAGARLPKWGGVAGTWRRDAWDPRAVTTVGARAWTRDYRGLSAFGSWEDFERGVPFLPPPADDEGGDGTDGGAPDGGSAGDGSAPGPSFTTGAVGRLGLRFAWRGLDAWAAGLTTEADTLHPLGLPMDRGGASLAGGDRIGWETSFRIPLLLMDGLHLVGAAQVWEPRAEPWPYFPRRTWNGALSFHDTFLPSENLELWVDVGMEGRDPMIVPSPVSGTEGDGETPPPVTVPGYRSWYARLQVRV